MPAADDADRTLDGEDTDEAAVGPASEGAQRDSIAVGNTAEGAAPGNPDFAPVVNVTEASAIDFDDEEVTLRAEFRLQHSLLLIADQDLLPWTICEIARTCIGCWQQFVLWSALYAAPHRRHSCCCCCSHCP